jgi:hypothetical protein
MELNAWVSRVGFPLELKGAIVTREIFGESEFLAFKRVLFTAARKRARIISGAINGKEYLEIILIWAHPNSYSAVPLRGRIDYFPSNKVARPWPGRIMYNAKSVSAAAWLLISINYFSNGRFSLHRRNQPYLL